MRDWFNAQTPRDQIALIALAGAVALYSLLTFALLPASEARSQMAANNTAAIAQLGRVEAKVSQLLDLRANSESAKTKIYPPLSVQPHKTQGLPSSGCNRIVGVRFRCDLKASNSTRCFNGYRRLRAMRA